MAFPGAGQLYNGESGKALTIVLATLACMWALFWSPYGLPHRHEGVPISVYIFIVLMAVIYLYAVIDANVGASGRRGRTGWEV